MLFQPLSFDSSLFPVHSLIEQTRGSAFPGPRYCTSWSPLSPWVSAFREMSHHLSAPLLRCPPLWKQARLRRPSSPLLWQILIRLRPSWSRVWQYSVSWKHSCWYLSTSWKKLMSRLCGYSSKRQRCNGKELPISSLVSVCIPQLLCFTALPNFLAKRLRQLIGSIRGDYFEFSRKAPPSFQNW
jgi:hypothetical protein